MTVSMEPAMPYFIAMTSYISFGLLFVFGHLRDFWRSLLQRNSTRSHGAAPKGYAPLCKDYEDFYTRRLFYRIHDVFNRPIASAPDAWIDVIERRPDPAGPAGSLLMQTTEATRRCLNLGSYNYLGFAAADPYCTGRVRPVASNACFLHADGLLCGALPVAGALCVCRTGARERRA